LAAGRIQFCLQELRLLAASIGSGGCRFCEELISLFFGRRHKGSTRRSRPLALELVQLRLCTGRNAAP